jgi:protein SCO1/2
LWLAFVFVLLAIAAQAQFRDEDPSKPAILQGVGLDQHLNWQVPPDATFRDETGRIVRLANYFGQRPVVLLLVYYQCPMLCTEVLNGATSALRAVTFNAGREFDVVAISIDPRETPQLAAEKKQRYVKSYIGNPNQPLTQNRAGTESGWHFLTGDEAQVHAVAAAVGFRYRYDAPTQQFVHPAAIMVLTPQGRVSHYFYGVEYAARDLRLALVEASAGRIGSAVDQVLLFCYHYDPKQGRYTPLVLNLVRAGGVLTLAFLGTFIGVMLRREKQQASKQRGHAA